MLDMRYSYFLLVLIFLSCSKKDFSIVEIVGHAGNGLTIKSSIYHDNSEEAIDLALGQAGVSGVEIDLQLSADNDLWLFHDAELKTETGSSGCVHELSNEQLKAIRYKTVNKEKLVRLKDLNFNNYSGKIFYLDIRHYSGCTQEIISQTTVLNALNDALSEVVGVQFIVFTSNISWVDDYKQAGWTTVLNVYDRTELNESFQSNIDFDGIIIRNSKASKEDVDFIKSKNKKVILFDIRAPKSIRQALKKQADIIIVDDLKVALIEKS